MELNEQEKEKLYKRIQELYGDEIEDIEDYEVYLEENKEFFFWRIRERIFKQHLSNTKILIKYNTKLWL